MSCMQLNKVFFAYWVSKPAQTVSDWTPTPTERSTVPEEHREAAAMEIKGAEAVVTGAAGGLGGAIARALHACGARLILTDRREEALSLWHRS